MQWRKVDEFSIRKMSALSLLLALMFAFAPPFLIALLLLTLAAVTSDVIEFRRAPNKPRLYSLLVRRVLLVARSTCTDNSVEFGDHQLS